MDSTPSTPSSNQPEAKMHHCELGKNKCSEPYEVLENHDTCSRGRIDAHQCLTCENIFQIKIVR
jgi:hypothetical protein